MNLNQFKKFEPWASLVYFIMLTIAGACGINAMRGMKALANLFEDGGGGIYTFLLVMYWILILPAAFFKVVKTLEETGVLTKMKSAPSNPNMGAQNNFAQPVNNNYNNIPTAQSAPVQAPTPAPVPTPAPTPAPVAQAASGKVCPNCGAAVSDDSQFCVNCGTKV